MLGVYIYVVCVLLLVSVRFGVDVVAGGVDGVAVDVVIVDVGVGGVDAVVFCFCRGHWHCRCCH